jgi:hypothetical protein
MCGSPGLRTGRDRQRTWLLPSCQTAACTGLRNYAPPVCAGCLPVPRVRRAERGVPGGGGDKDEGCGEKPQEPGGFGAWCLWFLPRRLTGACPLPVVLDLLWLPCPTSPSGPLGVGVRSGTVAAAPFCSVYAGRGQAEVKRRPHSGHTPCATAVRPLCGCCAGMAAEITLGEIFRPVACAHEVGVAG